MTKPLGVFTEFASLTTAEQEVVHAAWQGARNAQNYNLCFTSDFPVGAGILASNAEGKTRLFSGCNVENKWFPAGICAERNAATTAALEGYTHFDCVAVVCLRRPGGSPCGLCRQVLFQFGQEATLLNIVDRQSNVRRGRVSFLLPAAKGKIVAFKDLDLTEKRILKRLYVLKSRSHVPYSKRERAAFFVAENGAGMVRTFAGVSEDNASFGASVLAETVALRSARAAGYCGCIRLYATVEDLNAPNPIEGECLQVLREFAKNPEIVLVSPELSILRTTLSKLLPDSFGPENL